MTDRPQSPRTDGAAEPLRPPPARIVAAQELFAGAREICIEHGGVHYRLRITRRNKLILQK